MGTNSFVNQSRVRAAQRDSQAPGPQATGPRPPAVKSFSRQGFDWVLIGVVAAMTMFGLLMVYSAGPKFAMSIGQDKDYFLIRQAMWAVFGLAVAAGLSFFNYHFYRRVSVLMMVGTIIALLVAVGLADTTLGANRSIFSGSIRPSELAKLVAILYIAVWLNSKRDVLDQISLGLAPLAIILGVMGGLIFIQPDLSAAATVVILGGILFFMAGGAWRQIIITLLVVCIVGWLVVNFYPTGIRRITEYLAGLHNPLDASYHVQRSLEAIIHGGFFGVGIGRSSTKFTGLPVAPTDSIFAVIVEETGVVGAGLVILAYIVLLWRGLAIARNAPDQLGELIAGGVTVWIAIEALINMGVMVNLLPQAGNALPLISYGGSNLVVTLAAIGILMNVARSNENSKSTTGGNSLGAVVDLRWRDRRRSVSRYGRTPGSER
jgi:cell division protein FtsW